MTSVKTLSPGKVPLCRCQPLAGDFLGPPKPLHSASLPLPPPLQWLIVFVLSWSPHPCTVVRLPDTALAV